MPKLRTQRDPAAPWYGTYRELKKTLRSLGAKGASIQDCADHYGVARTTMWELFQGKRTVYAAYRRGLASLKMRTRVAVAGLAVPPEDMDDEEEFPVTAKDQLAALNLLAKMLKLDKPDERDAGDVNQGIEVSTMAELAMKVEMIEDELDSGERIIDPVTGKRPKARRSERRIHRVED